MPPQNTPLEQKDYSELIILRNYRQRRNSEKQSRNYFFEIEIYIYKENLRL